MEIKEEELWALNTTIAKFILPRIKKFKELTPACPLGLSGKEWKKILDDIIYAMEYYANDRYEALDSPVDYGKINRGAKLLGERFEYLWW